MVRERITGRGESEVGVEVSRVQGSQEYKVLRDGAGTAFGGGGMTCRKIWSLEGVCCK